MGNYIVDGVGINVTALVNKGILDLRKIALKILEDDKIQKIETLSAELDASMSQEELLNYIYVNTNNPVDFLKRSRPDLDLAWADAIGCDENSVGEYLLFEKSFPWLVEQCSKKNPSTLTEAGDWLVDTIMPWVQDGVTRQDIYDYFDPYLYLECFDW